MISNVTPDVKRYLQMYTSFINRYRVGQFSAKSFFFYSTVGKPQP
jgi:hypothetical protein